MKLNIYQVDAFTQTLFSGNPAAVVPLESWLTNNHMQNIAAENNLSETVFFVPEENEFAIRWFTPTNEVTLCGHATLAAAFVIFNFLAYQSHVIVFSSLSGELKVTQSNGWLTLDFPSQPPQQVDAPQALINGLGVQANECLVNQDYISVYQNEADILAIKPDLTELKKLDYRGVIITAPSEQYDFVARFFAPNVGIDEDPVTGSAFTQLVPYWAERLGKKQLFAKQVSYRGGELKCELNGERVFISGQAVLYLKGEISLPL